MDLDEELATLQERENSLELSRFSLDEVWKLGCLLRDAAVARGVAVAIEIRRNQLTAFLTILPGATANNVDWLRRKLAVTALFERSSYAVALMMQQRGTTLAERYGLALQDYVAAGGAVPIRVLGTGVVGAAAVSGLTQGKITRWCARPWRNFKPI